MYSRTWPKSRQWWAVVNYENNNISIYPFHSSFRVRIISLWILKRFIRTFVVVQFYN